MHSYHSATGQKNRIILRMNINKISNKDLFNIDWAANDRAAFLHSIAKPKPIKKGLLAPGLSACGVVGQDVSAMDRRSVKAQLAGRGDLRAAWWNLNERLHKLIAPSASTEIAMYAFHKRHHTLTFAMLSLKRDYKEVFQAIVIGGCMAGIRCAVGQMRRKEFLKK